MSVFHSCQVAIGLVKSFRCIIFNFFFDAPQILNSKFLFFSCALRRGKTDMNMHKGNSASLLPTFISLFLFSCSKNWACPIKWLRKNDETSALAPWVGWLQHAYRWTRNGCNNNCGYCGHLCCCCETKSWTGKCPTPRFFPNNFLDRATQFEGTAFRRPTHVDTLQNKIANCDWLI